MKKYLLLAATVMAFASPVFVSGQAHSAAPAKSDSATDFNVKKDKALAHISEHLTMWQKRQTCVQAATTGDALKVCMPPRKHKDNTQTSK